MELLISFITLKSRNNKHFGASSMCVCVRLLLMSDSRHTHTHTLKWTNTHCFASCVLTSGAWHHRLTLCGNQKEWNKINQSCVAHALFFLLLWVLFFLKRKKKKHRREGISQHVSRSLKSAFLFISIRNTLTHFWTQFHKKKKKTCLG